MRSLLVVSSWFLSLFLATSGSSAQEKREYLAITEVYLSRVQPMSSWIEVLNPTDKQLILQRVRISHLKTINVLNDDIQKMGGIPMEGGERLVLCADTIKFKATYGDGARLLEVRPLAQLAQGGFIAVRTSSNDEYAGMVARYGDPDLSANIEKLAGIPVAPFASEEMSWVRTIQRSGGDWIISGFAPSHPTPGR